MSDPQKTTRNFDHLWSGVKRWLGRLGWLLLFAVVFGFGWVAKASTIAPPPPPPLPKPVVHVPSPDEMRQKVQKEADAMRDAIAKVQNPDVRLGVLTSSYCVEWNVLKNVPVAWGGAPSVKQPGPDPSNIYSPLWNTSVDLYKDVTDAISAEHGTENGYPDLFAVWVNATCIVAIH